MFLPWNLPQRCVLYVCVVLYCLVACEFPEGRHCVSFFPFRASGQLPAWFIMDIQWIIIVLNEFIFLRVHPITRKIAIAELTIVLTISCTVKTLLIITCSNPKTPPLVTSLYSGLFLLLLTFDTFSYSLPTDVMTTVFKVGAKTEKGWSFLLSKYISISSEAEKNKILEALASSENVWKLYWYESTQGIEYIETKSIRTLCFQGGEPIFSGISLFLPLLTEQTWLGQCGKEPACAGWASPQGWTCRQKVLCPEENGRCQESQPPPTFCLNTSSPPGTLSLIPPLVLHSFWSRHCSAQAVVLKMHTPQEKVTCNSF